MKNLTCKISVLVIALLSLLTTQSTNAQNGRSNKDFEYYVVSSTPVNHLSPGKILGITNSEIDVRIVSSQILKGKLPDGIVLFDDGTIAVTQDSEHFKPGKYKVKAEFIDGKGKSFTEKIKVKLLKPSDHNDMGASIRVVTPKLTDHYKIGDIIAQFRDPNGTIKEAQLIKGSVPAGVMFVQNKNFVVTQPDQLKDGEYFCLFFLKDERGGSSVIGVSLPVGLIDTLEENYTTVDRIEE